MQTLKEIENQVKMFISAEKWQEAYRICNEMLRRDPDNSEFSKLKLEIEESVKANNIKSIKTELKKLEPLLKEENYQEYLYKIAPLQNYQEDFPEIGKIILRAKELWDKKIIKDKEELYKKEITDIKNLNNIDNLNSLLSRLDQLSKLNIHRKEIDDLSNKIKEKWINHEIDKNKPLLESEKFEDIIIFLLKLKKIKPDFNKVLNLIEDTKRNYLFYKIDNQKDYIFKTLEEIKTLYIMKKYDKAVILCERILNIDAKNSTAKSFMENSISNAEKISTRQIENDIQTKYAQFKQSKSYIQNNFTVI